MEVRCEAMQHGLDWYTEKCLESRDMSECTSPFMGEPFLTIGYRKNNNTYLGSIIDLVFVTAEKHVYTE